MVLWITPGSISDHILINSEVCIYTYRLYTHIFTCLRIIEHFRLEGTSGGLRSNLLLKAGLVSSGSSGSSPAGFSISSRMLIPPPLSAMVQCLTILMGRNCVLVSNWKFPRYSLCPLHVVLPLSTSKMSLLYLLYALPLGSSKQQ